MSGINRKHSFLLKFVISNLEEILLQSIINYILDKILYKNL